MANFSQFKNYLKNYLNILKLRNDDIKFYLNWWLSFHHDDTLDVWFSWSRIKKQEVTIKNFIKEEKEEVRWLNLTKCNIIVHNLGENKDEDIEEQRVGDKNYVEEVVRNQMGFKVNIVSAERIGARGDEMFKTKRWRPLKVVLRNEEEKRQILASVHKLEKCNFRVSEDFSTKERETIKEWHRKAKEKTTLQKDSSWIYKVRGSPRTKLYFKKICNKPVTENQFSKICVFSFW